jgi:hypothetical protein
VSGEPIVGPGRRPRQLTVAELLRELRDRLQDAGRLDDAATIDCCAAVAQHVKPSAQIDRTPRDVFLDALQDFDPCRCEPCPDCGGLAGETFRCDCKRCPSCGGLVDERAPETACAGPA